MQGQAESSGCPVPCCVPCAGERGQEKGARERTGAKEERAAQRVVYDARNASDLSRRMVGVACTGKRRDTPMGHETKSWGQATGQAGVQRDEDDVYGPRKGECRTAHCRASCPEGSGTEGEGVGESKRGNQGTV